MVWAVHVVGDEAAADLLPQLQARLRASGVTARIVDSTDSEQLAERGGLATRVLLQDGFPDEDSARQACRDHRTLAPACSVGIPR